MAGDFEALQMVDLKTIYTYVQNELIPYVYSQLNLRFVREEKLDWIDKQGFQPHSTNR
jgi:hypothetical protein